MDTDSSADAPALPRLHIAPGVFLVSHDINSARVNDPLTLERMRERLLVLHRRLNNQCSALSALRAALAGDHTIPREVAFVLDQYVHSEDITHDLEALIAELTGPPAFGSLAGCEQADSPRANAPTASMIGTPRGA
jgi:hypothetical protein